MPTPLHDLILIRNNQSPQVGKLKQALIAALANDATTYPGLTTRDNEFKPILKLRSGHGRRV